ncbi:hypothetical protein F2Q69_00044115 [Brassica cretica]|uniref:Uncharacterized protein n=1 Tax=Brassica cretica TaxID=69181 RepID=A0A8S9NPM8_BRACR|nr:hypothetical protein F2Q69_00044115 [Brassica cretica]
MTEESKPLSSLVGAATDTSPSLPPSETGGMILVVVTVLLRIRLLLSRQYFRIDHMLNNRSIRKKMIDLLGQGQTDPDRADILWEASSVMKLVVTVLQQCCLECLVNPTVRSSLIELKFGRGVVDWFILDLHGGISLWLPESL